MNQPNDNMELWIKVIIACTPVVGALLAWFLKHHIEAVDKAIESSKVTADKAMSIVTETVADFKADIKIIDTRSQDVERRVSAFATVVARNLEETRKTYIDHQSKLLDKSEQIIYQYTVLKLSIDDFRKDFDKLADKVSKHGEAMIAVAPLLRNYNLKLVNIEQEIEKIGKVVWVKDEKKGF